MQSRLFLNVVIEQGAHSQLFASKDQPLLVRGEARFVLDVDLHIFNGVIGLNLEGDGLTSQSLNKDLNCQGQ